MDGGGRDRDTEVVVELPEDIVIEILLSLPVKSLLKFKAVSKSWYSIINNTQFVKKHLNRAHASRYNQHKNFLGLFIASKNATYRCVLCKENSDGVVHALEFDFPAGLDKDIVWVCNYCDGLICFKYSDGILIWNPSLPKEYKIIQRSKLKVGCTLMGYDSTTDDYKIVSIPYSCFINRFPRKYFYVGVFSLKRKSWRKKKISNLFTYDIDICQRGIYTRNHLHWIGTGIHENNKTDLIIYFDLAEEKLDYVNLPKNINIDGWTMLIYKDSFGILGPNSEGQVELWVLEDYCGMRSSWSKIFKIESRDVRFCLQSCFTGNGEIPKQNIGGLKTYDVTRGSFKDVVIEDDDDDDIIDEDEHIDSISYYSSPYVESLVSPRW